MPVMTPEQENSITSSFKDVIKGNISADAVENELKKLLPEGDSFKFETGESKNPSREEVSELLDKNFSKFQQTAPDYTPPAEAFNAFKTNLESLESKAAPANEGPKASGPSSEDVRRPTSQAAEPNHRNAELMKNLKNSNPDLYNILKDQPENIQTQILNEQLEQERRNLLKETHAYDVRANENLDNYQGQNVKKAGFIRQGIHSLQKKLDQKRANQKVDAIMNQQRDAVNAQAALDKHTYGRIRNGIVDIKADIANSAVEQGKNINAYNKACSVKIPGFDSMSKEERGKAAENLMQKDTKFKNLHDNVVKGYDNLSVLNKRAEGYMKEADKKKFDFSKDFSEFNELSKDAKNNLPEPESETSKIEKSKNVFDQVSMALQNFCNKLLSMFTRKPAPKVESSSPSSKATSGPTPS